MLLMMRKVTLPLRIIPTKYNGNSFYVFIIFKVNRWVNLRSRSIRFHCGCPHSFGKAVGYPGIVFIYMYV